jgi:hypothetical protein
VRSGSSRRPGPAFSEHDEGVEEVQVVLPDMPDVPPDDVAWLRGRVAELEAANGRLREAAAAWDELAAAQLAARDAQIAALTVGLLHPLVDSLEPGARRQRRTPWSPTCMNRCL